MGGGLLVLCLPAAHRPTAAISTSFMKCAAPVIHSLMPMHPNDAETDVPATSL